MLASAVLDKLGETPAFLRANIAQLNPTPPTTGLMANGNGDDSGAFLLEKERHAETKRVLNITKADVERLVGELSAINGELEEARADAKESEEQLEEVTGTVVDLHRQLSGLEAANAKVVEQQDTIHALQVTVKNEIEARRLAEVEASISKEGLLRAGLDMELLKKDILLGRGKLNEKQSEVDDLQRQLAEARQEIMAKDVLLQAAHEDKKALQTTLFDTKRHLEDATAVIGETSLGLAAEVARFMNALGAVPRTPAPTV